MGLRINHNISSIMALRNLRINDRMQQRSLERLSTGQRINRASDDPSGLVISEQLRAQIRGLSQAVENSQHASNLIGTAEAALNEVQSLLIGIRDSVIFSINSGGNSNEQVSAKQDAVDNTISAIDRIAATTRFGSKPLLNGVSDFIVTAQSSKVTDLTLRNIQFSTASSISFAVNLTSAAHQANLSANGYVTAGTSDSIIRISGSLGVEDLTVASTLTVVQFDDAVNAMKWNTGVYSTGGVLTSIEFGSQETIKLDVVSGTFHAIGGDLTAASGVQIDDGDDIEGNVNGTQFTALGLKASLVSSFFSGDILFADDVGVVAQSFTVKKSGLTFQLNGGTSANDRETVGIKGIHASGLGMAIRTLGGESMGGYLTSLQSGGANDLFNNPTNALRIMDAAIDDISDLRAYLGAFKAYTIDTNINSLDVAIENLTSSESMIRDLDFAEETANFTRSQILFQAGTAVMAQANLIPQSVLTLLQ
jgi:flagellin